MFLRNQFSGAGRWEMPLVRKQPVDLSNAGLLAFTNTVPGDRENFDLGVHFFVDDFRFEDLYEHPEATFPVLSQYRFCCTPDFSVYGEMPAWRQLESVAHGRWVGACWQARGMTVVPTVSWDAYPSFGFCFEGVEMGCTVAVATYACRQGRAAFLRGYAEMMERIRPEAVLCYGEPFPGMDGPLIAVQPQNPRQLHRILPRQGNANPSQPRAGASAMTATAKCAAPSSTSPTTTSEGRPAMGGNGTFAAGKVVPFLYKTVGKVDGIKVLQGTGGLHNLPEESHSSKAYIKLRPDGNFSMLRFYGQDHRAKLEIAYHREPKLDPTGKPVLHYHAYPDGIKSRTPARKAGRKLYRKFRFILKGVQYHD